MAPSKLQSSPKKSKMPPSLVVYLQQPAVWCWDPEEMQEALIGP